MMSEWCDSNHWWKNAKFSEPNSTIPRNQIDEVSIDSYLFAYSVIDNACYGQIPYLQANNLNIVLSTGGGVTNVGNTRGFFNCAELDASNVLVGNNIILSHWFDDTYCQWNIGSFSGASNDVEQIIFEGLDYFILGSNSSINKSYIQANTIDLSGVTLKSPAPYITRLINNGSNRFSTLNNLSFVGDRIQYQGSFLVSGSLLEGTGNGKFIFKDTAINKANLSGLCLFENSFNEGIVRGKDTLFHASGGQTSINRGTVYGNAIFSGLGSINAGTVSGSTIFVSGGINKGTILEPAVFYSGTSNSGTLTKYSLFDYATNNGTLVSGSKFTFSTNNSSVASGSGDFLFLNNSHNRGSIGSSGTISFVSGSNNWSPLTAPSATVIFDLASFNNSGPINSIATFGVDCVNTIAGTLVTGIFNENSINSGTISSLGIFNNSSLNSWDAKNAIFYNRTSNSGRITESGRFEDSSHNGGLFKNGSFYGNSQHISGANAQNNAIFYGRSRNMSGSKITTLAEFRENSINYGDGTNTFNFFENAINYGYIESEDVNFSGSSINKNYAKRIHFYDTTINDSTGSGYDAAFLNNSINNGYIKHSGHFYNNAQNGKLGVLNTGTFHDFSINNGPMRRPLVSGLEVLTSGYRKINISDSGINNASLYNIELNVKISGTNRGNLRWVFDPLLIFTTSGIYNTGTTPHTIVETGTFRSSYNGAVIPQILFDGHTTNIGNIIGYKDIQFLQESTNYGNISTYPPIETNIQCVIFKGNKEVFDIPPTAIFCKNYGIIQNGASFNSGVNFGSVGSGNFTNSSNSGLAESANFNKSRNFGSIDRLGIFDNNSSNFGIINQSGFFYSSINMGPVYSGYFENSINSGALDIAQFISNSINSGNILQSGAFFNSYNANQLIPLPLATFSGSSNNSGIVTLGYYYGSSINSNTGLVNEFYDGSKNKGTVFQQATFSGSSINSGIVLNTSYFRDNSSNANSGIGLLFFYESSTNRGVLDGTVSFISTVNYGKIIGRSDVYFFSGATNNGSITGNAIFDLNSINDDDGKISNNATFLSGSFNNGLINNNAFFNNSDSSDGIINNNATFINNSFCSYTTINGSATFDDTSCYDKDTTTISGTIIKSTGCNP
jgi:hypothetical protein